MHLDVLLALVRRLDAHALVPALQVDAVLAALVVEVHQARIVLLELRETKQEVVRVEVLFVHLVDFWRLSAEVVPESLRELARVLEVPA